MTNRLTETDRLLSDLGARWVRCEKIDHGGRMSEKIDWWRVPETEIRVIVQSLGTDPHFSVQFFVSVAPTKDFDASRAALVDRLAAMRQTPVRSPRYDQTWCSQCGALLGPGDHGVSHCSDHGKKF